MTRFCVKCRFHDNSGYDDWCARPLSDRLDPVTGKHVDLVNRYCESERFEDYRRSIFGMSRECCGPSGRFFEERR